MLQVKHPLKCFSGSSGCSAFCRLESYMREGSPVTYLKQVFIIFELKVYCSGGNPGGAPPLQGTINTAAAAVSACSSHFALAALMKDFGKAEDPVGARLALAAIMFFFSPFRIKKKNQPVL